MDGDDAAAGTTGRRGRRVGPVVGGVVLAVLVVVGAFVVSPVAGTWVLVALAAALLLGGAAAARAGRRRGPATPVASTTGQIAPPPAADPPVREVDDLQFFFDAPPGSPAALTAAPAPDPAPSDPAPSDPAPSDPATPHPAPAAPPAATAASATPVDDGAHERGTARRIAVGLTAAAVVVVVGALVAAAVTEDDGPRREGPPGSADSPATSSSTARPAATLNPTPTPTAAPLTAAAAGDLALVSVPLGEDGLSARLDFEGIVLEPRAVGATVTAPAVSLSTDGETGLVHLTLPTWNCLEAVAPADPAAAGCTPAPTEYADLATPDLRVSAREGEVEVSGDFATYTRPNGSAPVYTGRTYTVTVQAAPDGRFRDGSAPATGEFSVGGSSTSTSAVDGLSVVQTG